VIIWITKNINLGVHLWDSAYNMITEKISKIHSVLHGDSSQRMIKQEWELESAEQGCKVDWSHEGSEGRDA
jgi:hypothetical protein